MCIQFVSMNINFLCIQFKFALNSELYSICRCAQSIPAFSLSLGQIAKWNESFRVMSGSIGCLDWLCLHIITYHTCLILFQYNYKDNCFKFMWVLLLVSNKEIKNGIVNTFLAFNCCFTKSKSAPAHCLSPNLFILDTK